MSQVTISKAALQGLVDFCRQPEIVAATDGAFDPDAYLVEAEKALQATRAQGANDHPGKKAYEKISGQFKSANSVPVYQAVVRRQDWLLASSYLANQMVFSDTAEGIEARLQYDLENSCPHCGGSGHKDDCAQGEPNDDMDYPDFCVISFGHAGYPLKHEVFVDVEEASIRANELDAKGFSIVKRQSTYTHPPSGANQGGVPEEVVSLVREAESACQDDGEQTLRESRLAQRWLDSLNQAVNLLTTNPNKPEQDWVPEGWKLVPAEPTEEMRAAARTAYKHGYSAVYRETLAAAPQPPQEQRGAE